MWNHFRRAILNQEASNQFSDRFWQSPHLSSSMRSPTRKTKQKNNNKYFVTILPHDIKWHPSNIPQKHIHPTFKKNKKTTIHSTSQKTAHLEILRNQRIHDVQRSAVFCFHNTRTQRVARHGDHGSTPGMFQGFPHPVFCWMIIFMSTVSNETLQWKKHKCQVVMAFWTRHRKKCTIFQVTKENNIEIIVKYELVSCTVLTFQEITLCLEPRCAVQAKIHEQCLHCGWSFQTQTGEGSLQSSGQCFCRDI